MCDAVTVFLMVEKQEKEAKQAAKRHTENRSGSRVGQRGNFRIFYVFYPDTVNGSALGKFFQARFDNHIGCRQAENQFAE